MTALASAQPIASNSDDSAITITNLQHQFDGKVALRDINTTIKRGKITGIVGPDGAGKTTIIRLLAGLLKATSGQIRVEQLDPIAQANTLRPQLG